MWYGLKGPRFKHKAFLSDHISALSSFSYYPKSYKFPSLFGGLRSWKIIIRDCQNPHFILDDVMLIPCFRVLDHQDQE